MPQPLSTDQTNRPVNPVVHRLWPLLIAVLAMALTMIPYLYGLSIEHGRHFMWLGYNLDDSCVYLSWMRQAADGSSRSLNLFTTDPQHGMAPNPLFWLLGRAAGIFHLPHLAVYHGARVGFGIALLLTVWRLICELIRTREARILAYLFVCFSSGLGWIPFWPDGTLSAPVDLWQPEAITFLSLYLSPLFCCSLLLQTLIVLMLYCGERTGRLRFALFAGGCGLLLGWAHTYDIVTMGAVWSAYLAVIAVRAVRSHTGTKSVFAALTQAAVAGAITLPSVLYIAYQLRTEAVFRARAIVPTLAPAPVWVLLGYGLTVALAGVGAITELKAGLPALRKGRDNADTGGAAVTSDRRAVLLLTVWAVVNVGCAYLPVAFQRKMLQGAHIPIAILAGLGAAWIRERINGSATLHSLPVCATMATLALSLTNWRFMKRDAANYELNLAQTRLHRTYLQQGEIAALDWLRSRMEPGEAVQPLPWVGLLSFNGHRQIYTREATVACFTPGLIGRAVYCGHWGETPGFQAKLAQLRTFATPATTDEQRIALLRIMKVQYILFSQKRAADTSLQEADDADEVLPILRGRLPAPPYLQLCYSNPDADIYQVVLPPL